MRYTKKRVMVKATNQRSKSGQFAASDDFGRVRQTELLRRLTSDVMCPGIAFQREDVDQHYPKSNSLKNEEDVPLFRDIVRMQRRNDSRDLLPWHNSHSCTDCDPAEDRQKPTAIRTDSFELLWGQYRSEVVLSA